MERQESLRDTEAEYSHTLQTMVQRMLLAHRAAHRHTQAMRLLADSYETDAASLEDISREIEREALEAQARVLIRRKDVTTSLARHDARVVARRAEYRALRRELREIATRQARAKQLADEAAANSSRRLSARSNGEPASTERSDVREQAQLEAKMRNLGQLAGTDDPDAIISKVCGGTCFGGEGGAFPSFGMQGRAPRGSERTPSSPRCGGRRGAGRLTTATAS